MVILSSKPVSLVFSTFQLWFAPVVTLENYLMAFMKRNHIFLTWLKNSFIYAIGSTIISTSITTIAAYAFSKFDFKLKDTLFALVLSSMMVPSSALAIPTYIIISRLKMINTFYGVILPLSVSAFGLYFMRIYIDEAVPDELIEAARVDGAGELRIFFKIVLGLILPGLVTLGLIIYTAAWGSFFLPLIIVNKTKLLPAAIGLYIWYFETTSSTIPELIVPIPAVIAGCILMSSPSIVVFLYLQKYYKRGLTLGGVK